MYELRKMGNQKKSSQSGTEKVMAFLKSEETVPSLIRDVCLVLCIVGAIALGLYLVSGTWPAVVAVESESMVPNMQIGDLVFVMAPDRFGDLTTWATGQETGYVRFGDFTDRQGNTVYGDVIIYRPNGMDSVHPIIHRALDWYDDGTYSGYITKGDNNPGIDQQSLLIGSEPVLPVKKEWIVGKALFGIPIIGLIPLHLPEVAAVVIILMILHELYLRRKEKDIDAGKKNR